MESILDELSIINPEENNIQSGKPTNKLLNDQEMDNTLNFSKIAPIEDPIINKDIQINQSKDIINNTINDFVKNIDENKKLNKKLTKEDLDNIPLPIFSCIYCSNDCIAFKHLSLEIISEKYLYQASNFDIIEINNLLLYKNFIVRNDNNKLFKMIIENTQYIKHY